MNSGTEQRIDHILGLIVIGLTRRQILEQVRTKFGSWKCSTRTLDRYIAAAHAILESEAKPIRARELGKALRRLDNLYARAIAADNIIAALAVAREHVALMNLTVSWPVARPTAIPAPIQAPVAPPVRRPEAIHA